LSGLNEEELGELLTEVEGYYEIEKKKNGSYQQFWDALKHVVNAERRNRSRKETTLHKSVYTEVQSMISRKSSAELLDLREDIRKSIREGRRSDIEYWELMEKEVGIEYSRAIIREVYQDLLAKQIDALTKLREVALKRSQEAETEENEDTGDGKGRKRPREGVDFRFVRNAAPKDTLQSTRAPADETTNRSVQPVIDDDADAMKFMRFEEDEEFEEMEEMMQRRDEISLPGSTYWWQDKYRPRKPRYFNRVRTGYDWNKYNKTHYDYDNPPPKTIQGYKFNVFYPDLIDVTETPKYFLEAADEREFAILRFHAGPPYEDIAFKILNQQWDIGRKSGFKCVFERGVLQLHFNFKRHFYRS
jgi:hypothetical protein